MLALVDYDQLGLYREPGVSEGIAIALSFLRKHLPVGGGSGAAVSDQQAELANIVKG